MEYHRFCLIKGTDFKNRAAQLHQKYLEYLLGVKYRLVFISLIDRVISCGHMTGRDHFDTEAKGSLE